MKFLVERLLNRCCLKFTKKFFFSVSSELAKIEFMALTTDGWTSKHQKLCFNSCTIHFLNEILEWKTINLGIQSKGHDANSTAVGLKNKLNKFKIFEKIKYIAVDNASDMRNTCKNQNKEFIGCDIDIEPIESDDYYSYSEEYTKALKDFKTLEPNRISSKPNVAKLTERNKPNLFVDFGTHRALA